MATLDLGETIICSVEIRSDAGTLVDPATSVKIMIDRIKPNFANVVVATDMTKDSTGKYHYDYQTATAIAGEYEVTYTATDGTRITIEKDSFTLD